MSEVKVTDAEADVLGMPAGIAQRVVDFYAARLAVGAWSMPVVPEAGMSGVKPEGWQYREAAVPGQWRDWNYCGADYPYWRGLALDHPDEVQVRQLYATTSRNEVLEEAAKPFVEYGKVLLKHFPKNSGFWLGIGTDHERKLEPDDFRRLIAALKSRGDHG